MSKKSLSLFKLHYGQAVAQYLAALLLGLGVVTFRLSQLLPGINSLERDTLNASHNLTAIRTNPVDLPYKSVVWLVQKLGFHSITSLRMISVVIGLVGLGVFYIIVRRWFGFWVAAATTFLLLTSSWFLHISRLATPDIGQLALLVLIGYGLWLKSERLPYLALLVGVLLAGASLYIPGVFWLVLFGAVHQRQHIGRMLSQTRWLFPAGLFLFGASMIPLVWGAIGQPSIVLHCLGLPSSLGELTNVGKHIISIPGRLLWHGPGDPSIWLPGTPLLDYLTAVVALLGSYNYLRFRKLDRSRITIGGLVGAIVLIGLTGSQMLGFLLPIVYLLVASGLAFMIQQWLTVFPVNPFARGLLVVLILLAVTSVSYYQLSHYFLAWARHPETRATFKPL